MVYSASQDRTLEMCSICESSTDYRIFNKDDRKYCICENCYNVIEYVIKELLNKKVKR